MKTYFLYKLLLLKMSFLSNVAIFFDALKRFFFVLQKSKTTKRITLLQFCFSSSPPPVWRKIWWVFINLLKWKLCSAKTPRATRERLENFIVPGTCHIIHTSYSSRTSNRCETKSIAFEIFNWTLRANICPKSHGVSLI